MAIITDLPDEVLEHIFSYLRLEYALPPRSSTLHGPKALEAFLNGRRPRLASVPMMAVLALTCRHIFMVANRQLYEHVVIGSVRQIDDYLRIRTASNEASKDGMGVSVETRKPEMLSFTIFARGTSYLYPTQLSSGQIARPRGFTELRRYTRKVHMVAVHLLCPPACREGELFELYFPLIAIIAPVRLEISPVCPSRIDSRCEYSGHHTMDVFQLYDFLCQHCVTLEDLHLNLLDFDVWRPPKRLRPLSTMRLRQITLASPRRLNRALIVNVLIALRQTLDAGGLTVIWGTDVSDHRATSRGASRRKSTKKKQGCTLDEILIELEARGFGYLSKLLTWEVDP